MKDFLVWKLPLGLISWFITLQFLSHGATVHKVFLAKALHEKTAESYVDKVGTVEYCTLFPEHFVCKELAAWKKSFCT